MNRPKRDIFAGFDNPGALVAQMDHEHTAPQDAYWAQVEHLILSHLAGDVDDCEEAKQLRKMRAGWTLETAARHCGFIMGFAYCLELLGTKCVEPKGGPEGGPR